MISTVILTKNNSQTIRKCLASVIWSDEIVIIDDFSSDDYLKKISDFKIKVFQRHLDMDFASQRNFGLQKAKGDWILFLDSDEVLSTELKDEIKAIAQNGASAKDYDGYLIIRKDYFNGRWLNHGETGNIKLLRLARKGCGLWVRKVHEYWNIKGNLGELKSPIYHYPHQTIQEFLYDINIYSTIHASELKREGRKANFFTIFIYPTAKFIQNYIIKLGFMDTTSGFIVSMMMSFHSFLSQGKLWQIQNTQKEV